MIANVVGRRFVGDIDDAGFRHDVGVGLKLLHLVGTDGNADRSVGD